MHTDTGGSRRTAPPTPTLTIRAHVYTLPPQKAPHTSEQGLLWGWAQCPGPRWYHHEVISAANRHQLPWSLTAAAGWGSKTSRAQGHMPRCQPGPRAAHPTVPAGRWGIPIWQRQHRKLGENRAKTGPCPRTGPRAPMQLSRDDLSPTGSRGYLAPGIWAHSCARTHAYPTWPKQTS